MTVSEIKKIINPKIRSVPSDDFRIIDSWTEYEQESKKPLNERKLEYLCYQIEVVNPQTGDKTKAFKALKFCRIKRLPKDAKQSKSFMDTHSQILSGIYEEQINMITIIANIIEPVSLGLLFLYGVQGIADNIDDAKKEADRAYIGLIGMLQATYRVMEMSHINHDESEWLKEKMYGMENITVVRGIPKAHNEGVAVSKSSGLESMANPNGQGTLEELITGMADYEYVVEILSTPVYMDTLKAWSLKTEQDMTDWYEQLQGTKSLSMNLSIPMMYAANQSNSQGWSQNYTDAESVTYSTGESYSESFGENQSHSISESFGITNGTSQSFSIGNSVTESNGYSHSTSISDSFGQSESISNGISENTSLSNSFGHTIGNTEGTTDGISSGHTQGTSEGTSHNFGFSNSESQSISSSVGESNGTTNGTTISEGHGTSGSTGWSQTTSDGESYGISNSHSESSSESHSIGSSHSTSEGNSINRGVSTSHSESTGTSITNGTSSSDSISQSNSHSTSNSLNVSKGYSDSTSNSYSNGYSDTNGSSQGVNIGEGQNTGTGSSSSSGTSSNSSSGNSVSGSAGAFGMSVSGGTNSGSSTGTSQGSSVSESESFSQSSSSSLSSSSSHSDTYTESAGTSHSDTYSKGVGQSVSNGQTDGFSHSNGTSHSEGTSQSTSNGYGTSYSKGESYSETNGTSKSDGWGTSVSEGTTESNSTSHSFSSGTSGSEGWSNSYSESKSDSTSHSTSYSSGHSSGTTSGTSEGYGSNSGTSKSDSITQSVSNSNSHSVSDSSSTGTSVGQGTSSSQSSGTSKSQSIGNTEGYSNSISNGRSESTSNGKSYSESKTNGTSDSVGTSTTKTNGTSTSQSTGRSLGQSMGVTGGTAYGASSSMGLGPSIGYSKSHQWLDQQVKDIIELLEFQNERVKKAMRGCGAFYTYVYIACPDEKALATAKTVAKSTWQNDYALTNPIQVLNLSEDEQRHLLYHFIAFSSDVTRENVYGVEEYKYTTVLLPGEFVAYTHPPRISEGGVFADIDDIPKFAVPSMLKGEIYMGTILSGERFTMNNGYKTPYDYRIDESELMHGIFTGASRSGKTVAAMRFVAELANIRRKSTGKRLRIVCMDPKNDWRTLARFVDPKRFKFYSMGNMKFHPIHLNPCKIPRGVSPQIWIDGMIDIYCRAYGLLERGKQMMGETIYALYEEAGVFKAYDEDGWEDKVPELSKQVTFPKVYERMTQIKVRLEDPTNAKGKAGNDTRDAYARLLDRLQAFGREFSVERCLFGDEDGMGVDDLIGGDDVTVLESSGLESTFSNFIFGIITSGFYKYAKFNEGGYLAPDQYETVLVIEEANKVLTGSDTCGTGGGASLGITGQSEFEEILDQSAGYGLFVFAITQKIAGMPSSIIANAGMVFAGRLVRPEDVTIVCRMLGKEERILDKEMVKWFPRSPIGWFICKSGRNYDYKSSEGVMVQIARLNNVPPSNDELDEILINKQINEITEVKAS